MDGQLASENDTVKVIVPTGMLGAGISAVHLHYGIERGAHAIGVDAGSTDSGPSYLARAVPKMNREAIQRDLRVLMAAAHEAKIPLLVGSCGTSGADAVVDWTAEIAQEVAQELGIGPKIACLYSEQDPETLVKKNRGGLISPLAPLGPVNDESLRSCDHIVALMGPEPYIKALENGADVVLGGRTTDTAVLAAVPLMRGRGDGPAWHAAKVAECGGQCTVKMGLGGVLISVGRDCFEIEPLDPGNRCTPESVSAHMLYESNDPNFLIEPGGVLDVSGARYSAANARVTRVSGAVWRQQPYSMKLEGARSGPYQTIMLIGIEDPAVLARLEEFHDKLQAALVERIRSMFASAPQFDVSLRFYGWNGVSGRRVPAGSTAPREVGVLFVVTAPTQDLADQMARACNPYFFHFPVNPNVELPSYAFPFTPAEIPRGRVYEFVLNHVVRTADPYELTRTRWVKPGQAASETLDRSR
jgi:Acyclic terpene utilisation family protein AtuA